MTVYRRYHFPPLTRLLLGDAEAPSESAPADPALTEEVLEEYRKAGYAEGLADGLAEGGKAGREGAARAAKEARAALDALSGPFEALMAGFGQLQKDLRTDLREQVAGLVEQVARQVIRTELEAQPGQYLALIDEALAELPAPSDSVQVRLHPDDYQRVLDAAPRRAKRYGLVPDPQLEPGECRISAGERELDVGCAQRLVLCMEQVRKLLGEQEQSE
ncbi:FliH/SctL family protein [Dyella acidiphila]|uniref:Flagellar assembly protein FliH n=1 Tax=Dyella acidiphila TaxID=2775866 RepID=A0ABR9G978_9GAMM|nr:FliH/SctL family protein [Dyella acidiphila]MBE1160600.1 flagellar assembly protein FliH [Dyella acidiphila]